MSGDDHNHSDDSAELATCEHSIELLLDYLDGTLPPSEKKALDLHFRVCPPCIDFVKKYKSTPGLCQQALKEELPKELEDRLTSFLRAKLPHG